MIKSIVIAGVGGQGTLLASRLIGKAALAMDYDVKISEVHGMAQRGGSVITYVRYGDESIKSPIIPLGEADILIAFEQLEALRWTKYLKKGGLLLSSSQRIEPMPVITGKMEYPEGIGPLLCQTAENMCFIGAYDLAVKAGSPKMVNTVLIGRAARFLDIEKDIWLEVVKTTVPKAFIDMNLSAFEAGYNF